VPLYDARCLGPLPVDLINTVLGTELEPGNARLSSRAHSHIAIGHPNDYAICIAALDQAISAPTFVGQDPKQADNFVLVKRDSLPDGKAVLVAIGLKISAEGLYSVRSSYLISQKTIDERRSSGRLKIPPPQQTKGPT
jgi:hypothetical protein